MVMTGPEAVSLLLVAAGRKPPMGKAMVSAAH